MQVITEEAVRQMVYKQKLTEIAVAPEDFISIEAKRYIREKGFKIVLSGGQVDKGVPAVNSDIRPVGVDGKKPRFTDAVTGQTYDKKPEHMTHLHAAVLVPKNHPRIVLRGKLDSFEAELVMAMVRAKAEGRQRLVADLNELLSLARRILAAEVTEKPLEEQPLLGLDSAGLREASHNPQARFNRGHILPSEALSFTGATLNLFRARVREVELAAMDAFWQDDQIGRPDLIKALNRMSSACYIMMFFELSGRYAPQEKAEGQQ